MSTVQPKASLFDRPKYMHRTEPVKVQVEDDRTGMSVETLARAIADNLYYIQGKGESFATLHDYYMALSYTIPILPWQYPN